MAVHIGLAVCLAVLMCSFQPTVSEHKKKIIVKVPHLIKHIHHDVYKPVHVHKVHAKKVEHHHHEEHEEKLPKWRPKLKKGHHKARGSYSHLTPILHHREGVERQVAHRQGMEYGMAQGYGREHDYSKEAEGSLENYSEESISHGRPYNRPPHERIPHDGLPHERSPHERKPHGDGSGREHDYKEEAEGSLENHSEERIPYNIPPHERIPHDGLSHERKPHGHSSGREHDYREEAEGSLGNHSGERIPHKRIPYNIPPHERIPHDGLSHERSPHERKPHGHGSGRVHDYREEAEGSLENHSGERMPHGRPHNRLPHERIPYDGSPNERIPDDGLPHERLPPGRKPNGHGSREGGPNWEPINLGGWFGGGKGKDSDEWLISSEDLRELKEEYGILGGKADKQTGQKRIKDKPLSKPKKPVVIDMEKEGWKPMMDFKGWKDVEDFQNDEPRGYRRDPYNYSGEDESEENSEERFRDEEEYPDSIPRSKPRKNSKKSGKWSKPIEVREPSSEEDPTTRHRQKNPHRYPLTPQVSYQQAQRSDDPHDQPQQRLPSNHKPQKNWPEPLPTPQAHHWLSPQPTPKQTSSAPQSQPSSVVWSGHHLQTPQHTMWHVQQHNVETTVHGAGSNPPPLPIHPPPLAPLQSQQASVPAQRVAAPAPAAPAAPWPPTKKSPGVMQQWEQTVHMGDGDGPGSSYKVEVINYSK